MGQSATTGARQMTAGFSSRCLRCPVQIRAGEEIFYQRGTGSWHVTCPTAAAKTVARPSTSSVDVEAAPYIVYETWRASVRSGNAAALAAEIGTTRLYELGPDTRHVRSMPATRRSIYDREACPVCGAAGMGEDMSAQRSTCTGPSAAMEYGVASCLLPAVPAHDEPVPEVDRCRALPKLREGATAAPAGPGVYVVVGAGPWRYQNREDNEDMGDMQGPNWSGAFFLRPATAEEAQRDAAERWEAGRPQREFEAEKANQERLEQEARATFALAAASTVSDAEVAAFVPPKWMGGAPSAEQVRGHLGSTGLSSRVEDYLTEEEMAERMATMVDVWIGRKHSHGEWSASGSYIRAWSWRGQIVMEEYTYIYDFDQPVRLAGCAELLAHVRACDAERMARIDAERAERAAREAAMKADPRSVLLPAFLAALEVAAQPDPKAYQPPLAADWTVLRDEVLALGASAFSEPAPDAPGLAKVLWSGCGGLSRSFHDVSPRHVYTEWKALAVREATERAARVAAAEREAYLASTREVQDYRGDRLGHARRIPLAEVSLPWKSDHVIEDGVDGEPLLAVGEERRGGKVVARRVVFTGEMLPGHVKARRVQYLLKPRSPRAEKAYLASIVAGSK